MNTPVLQKYRLQGLKKVQKGSHYSNSKNKKKNWEFLNVSYLNFTTFALLFKKMLFFMPSLQDLPIYIQLNVYYRYAFP